MRLSSETPLVWAGVRKHCRKHHPEWLAALDEQAKGERINNRSELYCTVRRQVTDDEFRDAGEQSVPAKRQRSASPTTDLNTRLSEDGGASNQRSDSPSSSEDYIGILIEEDGPAAGQIAGMLASPPFPRFARFESAANVLEVAENETGCNAPSPQSDGETETFFNSLGDMPPMKRGGSLAACLNEARNGSSSDAANLDNAPTSSQLEAFYELIWA